MGWALRVPQRSPAHGVYGIRPSPSRLNDQYRRRLCGGPPSAPGGQRPLSLPAILAMAVVAILTNQVSMLALAEWGADQSPATLAQLSFPTAQSTVQRLFARLNCTALSAVLAGEPDRCRPTAGARARALGHRERAASVHPRRGVSRIHAGQGSAVVALLRDTAVSLLDHEG